MKQLLAPLRALGHESDFFRRSGQRLGRKSGQGSPAIEIAHTAAGEFAGGRIKHPHGGSVKAGPTQPARTGNGGTFALTTEHGRELQTSMVQEKRFVRAATVRERSLTVAALTLVSCRGGQALVERAIHFA